MSQSSGRLAGKTVLITAAAQGIGRASVELFAREGARVIATDISKQHLDELAGFANVETHLLDVTDDAAIKALVAKSARSTCCSIARAMLPPATSWIAMTRRGISPST